MRLNPDANRYEVSSNHEAFTYDGKRLKGAWSPLHVGSSINLLGATISVEDLFLSDEKASTEVNEEESPTSAGIGQNEFPELSSANGKDSFLRHFLKPIAPYLDDDDVSEIMINGPDQIFVERKGKLEVTDAAFLGEESLVAAMKNVARSVGRRLEFAEPRLDARLPDGSRVHAVIPPMARNGTVVAIRKFSRERLTVQKLIDFGSLDQKTADLIKAAVSLEKNIIVSGPTSSGKTSVLNVLSSYIPDEERILVIEDASELQLGQEHLVRFEARKPDEHGKGEVSIRDLVHSSLRLRPDRLVVGEVRGGEALDLLQALNTGHAGSMSTIHANGPADALRRLETCALLSGIDVPLSALREQVASAVNMVIHTARLADGSRKIIRVAEVRGLRDGDYWVDDLVRFESSGLQEDGTILGAHQVTGNVPTFLDEARVRGLDTLLSPFYPDPNEGNNVL